MAAKTSFSLLRNNAYLCKLGPEGCGRFEIFWYQKKRTVKLDKYKKSRWNNMLRFRATRENLRLGP